MCKAAFTIAFMWLLACDLQAQVRISQNAGTPANSSGLDVDFSDKGFLPPRMNTAARNAITSPAAGLTIYNTEENCLNVFNGTMWKSLCGCDYPIAPVASAASGISQNSFSANWGSVAGASYYLLDVSLSNTFATFLAGYQDLNVGNVTSYGVSGLTATTTYYYRAKAVSSCGVSNLSNTIAAVTTAPPPFICGTSTITINHSPSDGVSPVTKSVTYGTISSSLSGAAKCWIDRNLGASNIPGASNDATEASAGWYWQFNRKQGYQHDGTTRTPNTAWPAADPSTTWTAAQDPCLIILGTGWRIPLNTEYQAIDAAIAPNTATGIFGSPLKFHMAGSLSSSGTFPGNRGTRGVYSSSNATSSNTHFLDFDPTYLNFELFGGKQSAYTLRCIKD